MSTVNFVIVNPEISHAEFIKSAAEQFPAIAAEIFDEDYEGLIHLQVACLTRYANGCLDKNNLTEFERILRFVDYVLPKVDSRLDNALHVSFVEDLGLDEDTPVLRAAKQLLSGWQLDFYVAIRNWESDYVASQQKK